MIKGQLTSYHLVCVIWDDAFAVSEQTTLEEIEASYHKAQRFSTFGLLLKDSESGVTLAGELESNGQFRHVAFIPKKMIVEVIDFGIPKKPVARRRRARAGGELSQPSPTDASGTPPV